MVWARGFFGLTAGLLLTGLTACHQDMHVTSGAACFPAEAARWVAVSPAAGTSPSATQTRAPSHPGTVANIYVDRSGSMLGYIDGGTSFERPFVDLVHSLLPDSLATLGVEARYRPFDRRPPADLPDGRDILTRPDSYRCLAPHTADCDNQESHIDSALAEIARDRAGMAVILSDLWFSNSDISTTGDTSLQPLLTSILGSNRVIAVYGIDSPFAGQVSDIPDADGAGTFSVAFKGRHPLYMIVVGSAQQIVDLDRALTLSGAGYMADGFKGVSGRIHRSIFALRPESTAALSGTPFDRVNNPALLPVSFEPEPGVSVQQFELKPVLPRPGVPAEPVASWTGPRDDAFMDGAVWHGPVKGKTRIWLRRDTQCRGDASWIDAGTTTDGWSDAGAGRQSFVLDPVRLSSRLRQKGVFVISGEVERTSLNIPGDQDGWMHAQWSLPPERAAAMAAQKPDLFPTLNLGEFARLMENALADAAEHNGSTISGFTVMVKVGN